MRDDLRQLTPDAIAALANTGLVKRAQREIEAGQGPALSEAGDGTVTGVFPDGVRAVLPPGVPLARASCTCGATTVCRHRVAVALMYAGGAASSDAAAIPQFTDEALEKAVGKRVMQTAARLRSAGVVAHVEAGNPPTVRLPTCTVRFLVADDLAYALCDCQVRQGCEHVVLAVWAFRMATAPAATVDLRDAVRDTPTSTALQEAVGFVSDVLWEGIVHTSAPHIQERGEQIRRLLNSDGLVWMADLVEDIEISVQRYHDRHARYRPATAGRLVTEAEARRRAAAARAELPAAYVLGQGTAPETRLDHVRLISLGARIEAWDDVAEAELFLASPDTGDVLVLSHTFRGEAVDGESLAARTVSTGIRLGALATGQMVSTGVKRRANRAITLATSRTAHTSVTPQTGAWEGLPPPLLVSELETLYRALADRPPWMLRPRLLAETMVVLAVDRSGDMAYDPAQQMLYGMAYDRSGAGLRIEREYRKAAPGALAALWSAWQERPRFIAGDVRIEGGGLVMDPLSVVTDRVIVLDIAPNVALHDVPWGVLPQPVSDTSDSVQTALETLWDGVHQGLHRAPGEWWNELQRRAHQLASCGLMEAASAVQKLAAAGGRRDDAIAAFGGAALRLSLTEELLR